MEKKFADLHIHTFYSDSTFSPEEVVKTANLVGLKAIAICDHDCIDGISPCMEVAKDYDIEIIPGVELTAEKEDIEIHILGYFMDWKASWFREKLEIIQKSRVNRIYKMLDLLREKGIDIKPEQVFKLAGKGSVGRLHVAFAMLKTRKIRHLQEAFNKYIGYLKSCYVSHIKFTPKEAIEMVLRAGGVPVLAHPRVMGKDEFIPEFIKSGLRGIEIYHTDHGLPSEKKYLKIAKENNLLITGGSDCHGLGKGRVLIGNVKIPYSLVEKLKEEANKIKEKKYV
ncbi:MAG: PHP domain-containing protein [Candidatus Omnitrophica bacterium]|nr:PHP domain-containing protein [Candidatus Omnitrophota bacterium]